MSPAKNARVRLLDAMADSIWERSYGSTSVDSICDRAEVGKGSFYHFFKSKTELAIQALDHLWNTSSRPALDEVFSPSRPPIARFERLIEFFYKRAVDCKQERGRVLGCPFFNLGAETAASEPELAAKIATILDQFQGYLEAALNEAKARQEITVADPPLTAALIFSLLEGCSTQARIHDDPERVRHLGDAIGRILGTPLEPRFSSKAFLNK